MPFSAKEYGMLSLVIVGQDRQLARAMYRAAQDFAKKHKGDASMRLTLLAAALSDALNTTHVTVEENNAQRLIDQATGRSQPPKSRRKPRTTS
jgi:hypothetical protein